MSARQFLVTAVVVATVVAVLTGGYFAFVATIGPTPDELAERFIVVADNESANLSLAVARRIMALDANGDTYLARQELPERMDGLMRGDRNRDGLLSTQEVATLVTQTSPLQPLFAPPSARRPPTGLYEVVNDLRLAPAKRDVAMDLLRTHASSDAFVRLRQVLDSEEYENLAAAAARVGLVTR